MLISQVPEFAVGAASNRLIRLSSRVQSPLLSARHSIHSVHHFSNPVFVVASAGRLNSRSAPPTLKPRGPTPKLQQKDRQPLSPKHSTLTPPALFQRRVIFPSPPMETVASQAATLLVQNMMLLCRQLRLPVSYKVLEWHGLAGAAGASVRSGAKSRSGGSTEITGSSFQSVTESSMADAAIQRKFSVIVHVHGDHAFKKYLENFSCSDMLLYRGLLLQVVTSADLSTLVSARVQQAFLPKFENEDQDVAVAEEVVKAAARNRPTVITVKHSGSLLTLSYDGGWAAKNSVANEFTAGGAALLRSHYDRCNPDDPAAAVAAINRLFETMAARRLSLSFEMVTGSHGHHGQLPAAEYLVATAAHSLDPVTGAPSFLPWLPFLELCVELGLPTNDTWVVAGGALASAARQTLDALALSGGPTRRALSALDELVSEGGGSCIRLPGTYPHDEWQGTRLEGFVVAAGQELQEEELRRLHAIRNSLAASKLPLAVVPEQLHRPYQQALREATAAAVVGNGAVPVVTAAADATTSVDVVRSRLLVAAAAWMPQAALSYISSDVDAREKVVELLTEAPPEGLVYGKPYMELSQGRGRLYSRLVLERLGTAGLQELLAAEEAAGAGGSSARTAAPCAVAVEAASSASPPPHTLLVRAMRALAGHPETSSTLRYKKKMLMWSFPEKVDAKGEAEFGSNADDGGVVGYSLMTFVIRNGLPALRQGTSTYMAYVNNLVRRSWDMPRSLVPQVQHFARCWAAWVEARGGAAALNESHYLDIAEPFAREFLARRGALSLSGRSKTAFQGVLLCVDTPEAFTEALQTTVAPAFKLSPTKLGDSAFTKGIIPGGAMLWLKPDSEVPKKLREFLRAGAAPFTWVVATAGRKYTEGPDDTPAIKRQKGLANAKVSAVISALGADNAASRVRHVTFPDDIDGAASMRLAAEICGWLGHGTPLPTADAAVATFFVTIPGAGKSSLMQGLTLPPPPAGSGPQVEGQRPELVTLKVLNSDVLKKTVKNMNPNRYWFEVATAAESYRGNGHSVVSVADKNLVPSPCANIARALEPLKGTGVGTLAVVPVVAGSSTLSSPAPYHSDLYGGLPDLPFPLELIALCMLRTIKRQNHEGGLDGETCPSAATVVAMFAGFYRHKTLSNLLGTLRTQFTRVVELPIMRGDGVAAAAALDGGGSEANDGGIVAVGGGGSVPTDVLRHVAEGVRDVSEQRKPQLPAAWEARTRELLLRPDVEAALEALQLPMGDVRRRLAEEVAATLNDVKAAATTAASGDDAGATLLSTSQTLPVNHLEINGFSAAAADDAVAGSVAEERVLYFSVVGFDEEALRSAARQVLGPELSGRLRRGELHLTLWHRADSNLGSRTDVRRALLEAVGSSLEMEVTHIDISPQVVAANVRLLSADEAITAKPYHHITLLVELGHNPSEANQLPSRLAAAELGVERRPLPGGPLLLRGVVTAVEAEVGGQPQTQGSPKRQPNPSADILHRTQSGRVLSRRHSTG